MKFSLFAAHNIQDLPSNTCSKGKEIFPSLPDNYPTPTLLCTHEYTNSQTPTPKAPIDIDVANVTFSLVLSSWEVWDIFEWWGQVGGGGMYGMVW